MTQTVNMEATVEIKIEDGTDWLWYVEPGRTKEWRGDVYGLETETAIQAHWAWNAVTNGIQDASHLDGWADIPRGKITFNVTAEAL